MKKRMWQNALLSSVLLTSAIVLGGCGSNGKVKDDGKKVSTKDAVADISKKYAKEEKFVYNKKQSDVKRDKGFAFEVSKEAKEKFSTFTDNWNDIIQVYRDSNLKQSVAYKANNDESGVTISPYRNAAFALPDKDLGGTLFDQGEWNDWGNAQQYYMEVLYDLQTGEKLEKPELTIFTVDTEIDETPQVSFYVSEDGIGGLKWDKVKGAKEYAILEIKENKDGNSSGRSVEIITTTKDTKWEDRSKDESKNNWNFKTTFGTSFDTYYGDQKAQVEAGTLKVEDLANQQFDGESEYEKTFDRSFAVIAINKKGTSKVSNFIDKRMAANQVPVSAAFYMNEGGIRADGDRSKAIVDRDVAMAPSHTWVVMANGNVTQKLVNYDIKKVKQDTTHYVNYEEDENGNIKKDENGNPVNYKSEDIPCLSIPFTIEGTSIKGYAQILSYDKKNYKNELKELKKRQDKLRDKTGDIEKEVNLSSKEKNSEDVADELYTDYNIYASNALSEYLALQMLNGQTRVNLDDYDEAMDQEYLLDAWYEAIYQNPLTLGVKSISYDSKKNDLLIRYDQDADTLRTKQVEIKNKVKEINGKIIKEGMTPIEKETAINDYLCANAEYDQDALANAEKNNFKKVDEKFNDSFTAYGILMNQKGVCAGYAASFKLLADEAGLENIVVTGYLQGSLPHAWNRVKMDEQWYTLDTTNNDNEFFFNGLFNLSDVEASNVLNEDKLYAMDADIETFKANDDSKEYYRVNGKYFSQSDIVSKLVADLNANGQAVYRTDVTLTEDQFYAIAEQVIVQTQDVNLEGGYFLGVIFMKK